MSLEAQSPEFSRLVTAWLDGTASVEEAAQLWQAVAADERCALEFAAAARFEALLTATVQEHAGEKQLMRELETVPAITKPPLRRSWARPAPLALAAALAILALSLWLLLPRTVTPQLADSPPPKPHPTPASRAAAPSVKRLAVVAPSEPPPAGAPEISLPDRLDRFFLPAVALEQVPLQRALGLLQGQLLDLNFLDAEALKRLHITIPTEAATRRITFHAGPISFLKAVRAVAALGGCDVTVDEPTLALVLHRGLFPEVPSRKDVRELLAGRTGAVTGDDHARVAALMADAASLGIAVDPSRPLEEQTYLPITRGQWLALEALTEAREQLSRFAAPSFQLFLTDDATESDRVINEAEGMELRQQLQSLPNVISQVVAPGLAEFNYQAPMVAGLTVQPLGEATQVTFTLPAPEGPATGYSGSAAGEIVTATLSRGQGAVLTLAGSIDVVASALADGMITRGGNLSFSTNGAANSSTQVILLPNQNPPP